MTTLGGRARCPHCGAQLRRGRPMGQRCDPCQRKGRRLMLPEGFYDRSELTRALAGLGFGPVFVAIRAHTGWSQEVLGEFLGLDQGRISRIETGKRALLDLDLVVHVANRLQIPAGKLGFTHGVTVGAGTTTTWKDGPVERRGFVDHVGGLTFGVGGHRAGCRSADRVAAARRAHRHPAHRGG